MAITPHTLTIDSVKTISKRPPPLLLARINNEDRPDEAFTTERAVRNGRANAASGRIMVNVPNDHFGPIPAEADPRGTVRGDMCLKSAYSNRVYIMRQRPQRPL